MCENLIKIFDYGLVLVLTMDSNELRDKLSVIKPYTFYGNDPPRRLSKEPSKILEPLMGESFIITINFFLTLIVV